MFFFSGVKSLKKFWNEQKRLKTAEKTSLTSFWVRAAPKSWSKYITYVQLSLYYSMYVNPNWFNGLLYAVQKRTWTIVVSDWQFLNFVSTSVTSRAKLHCFYKVTTLTKYFCNRFQNLWKRTTWTIKFIGKQFSE